MQPAYFNLHEKLGSMIPYNTPWLYKDLNRNKLKK